MNVIWGLDLTYVTDSGRSQPVLGLIDHGTRACLELRALRTKSSIVILRNLLDVFDLFGEPKVIRTDNELIFFGTRRGRRRRISLRIPARR